MQTILPVLIGALVTAVLGNFLVQKWQLRTWREQQRQLGLQAELEEMKKLLEEITAKAADRHNAMRRLLSSLAPETRTNFERALTEYQNQVATWNAALNSFYVRIRLTVDYVMTLRFEREVHRRFYEAGIALEEVVRSRRDGVKSNWSDLTEPRERLNYLQGSLYVFLRDLTDHIEKRRDEIFFGKKLYYRTHNLREYSLLELIKALFTSNVDAFYVVRSS